MVVTRPKERAGTLAARLRAMGAQVVEYPCIETAPILPCPAMEAALNDISGYEWLAFTSAAGVETVWRTLEAMGRDARALGSVKLAAIGPGTAKALLERGLRADYVPEVYDAAHLGEGLAGLARGKVLLLRAELGSKALTDALDGAKISYDDIAVYRTVYDNPRSEELRERLLSEEGALVTFTSASTVRGFVSTVGEDFPFERISGVCIGAQTAAQARDCGIPVVISERATIDSMVEKISSMF